MKRNSQYIGVDEKYIPENEKYVDDSLLGNKEETKRKIGKTFKIFGISYLAFIGIIIALIITGFVVSFKIFGSVFDQIKTTTNQVIQNNGAEDTKMRDEFFNQYNSVLLEIENNK